MEFDLVFRDLLLKLEPTFFGMLAPVLKSRKARVQRSLVAQKFVKGEGAEIGAFVQTIMTPRGSSTTYIDRFPASHWKGTEYAEIGIVDPDIVDDAKYLRSIPDARFDYLVAAHVLEHIDDPIEAMRNWLRVVKRGAYLVIAVPDKRFTADSPRKPTSLDHLLRDHIDGPQAGLEDDCLDFGLHSLGITNAAALQRRIDENRGDIHFHTWTLTSFVHFLTELNAYLGGDAFEIVEARLNVNEALCVLRKAR